MDVTEFVDKLREALDAQPQTPEQLYERSEGHIIVYARCTHCDDGIDPVAVFDTSTILHPARGHIGLRLLSGVATHADEVFVMLRATTVDLDGPEDLEYSPEVLKLTQPKRLGWMLWHVTLAGVEHHHLNTELDVRTLSADSTDPNTASLERTLLGIIAP